MIKGNILNNISSKFILSSVFNFIKNENFKNKLFSYSKLFQKKLNLNFNEYKDKYISQIGLDYDNYLSLDYNIRKFDKDILKKVLQKELLNFNITLDEDIIKIIIVNYFKKYIKYLKEYNIDIYSPFFDLLAKSELIENFRIKIMLNKITEYNLTDDYISVFNELNKRDSKYPPLKFYCNNGDDINYYFQRLNINFRKIKTLIMINEEENEPFIQNFNHFFVNFFSFNDIQNNLIHLELIINSFYKFELFPALVEKLNDFKSLKQLKLKGFQFKNNFIFILDFLEILEIINCKNIIFNSNKFINLKKLILINNSNLQINSLLKAPELEECELTIGGLDENFKNFIDYSSLNKLKICKINSFDFLNFDNTLLNKLILNSNRSISSEDEREILEKIISIKTLKDINFELYKIDNDEISKIRDENSSITKIEIIDNSRNIDFNFFLEKLFPNLSDLIININNIFGNKIKIEIGENSKCKIDKFSLTAKGNKNIKFYIKSFEELISASFNLKNEIINIKNAFPIFNDKCLVIFKYLTTFVFEYSNEIGLDILMNIY